MKELKDLFLVVIAASGIILYSVLVLLFVTGLMLAITSPAWLPILIIVLLLK